MSVPGTVYAGYRLGAPLSPGRIGTLYAAEHERTGAAAAVRLVPGEQARAGFAERALAAARAQAGLDVPHVVRVHAADERDGTIFVVAERVNGPSLSRLLDSARAPQADAVMELLRDVAGALDAAHDAGLVHGDVSSREVLVDRERGALLGDFGITREGTVEEDRRDFAALVYEALDRDVPADWEAPLSAALAGAAPRATELLDAMQGHAPPVVSVDLDEDAAAATQGAIPTAVTAPVRETPDEPGPSASQATKVKLVKEPKAPAAPRTRRGLPPAVALAGAILVGIVVMLCAAVIGFNAGGGNPGPDDGRAASGGGVQIRVPEAWGPLDAAQSGLELGAPAVLAAGTDERTLLAVAVARDTGSDLLPDELAGRLGRDPVGEPVSVGGELDALSYTTADFSAVAVPTTDGVVVAGCAAAADTCTRVLSTLRLDGLRARPFSADREVVADAGRTFAAFERRRTRGRSALRAARRAGSQSAAASDLARAADVAAKELGALKPGPLVAEELGALRTALTETGTAYRRLSAAAARRDRERYATAVDAVGTSEEQLAAAGKALRGTPVGGGA